MTLTLRQSESISKDVQNYAGDQKTEVEVINETIYVYTSELGAYRINAKYASPAKTRVAYSENLKTWYFALDM